MFFTAQLYFINLTFFKCQHTWSIKNTCFHYRHTNRLIKTKIVFSEKHMFSNIQNTCFYKILWFYQNTCFCVLEVVRFVEHEMIVSNILYMAHYPIFNNLTNFYMGFNGNMRFAQFLCFSTTNTCVFGQIKVV
jgi:hypothetical protein